MTRSRMAVAGVTVASLTAAAIVAVSVLGMAPPLEGATVAAARAAVVEFPTEVDYCYVEGMRPHHEQALEMSELVLAADGVSDRVRALAEFIVVDQTREIEQMSAWRQAWDDAVAESSGDSPAAHAHEAPAESPPDDVATGCGHSAHTEMAGMATPDQLAALGAASGSDAERLFLQLMIVHHEGALVMAEKAVREGRNAFIRSSGKHVIVEQKREIDAMTALLAAS